jgi:hypothetical protein
MLGPGVPVQVHSDFIGPLPTGSEFIYTISRDAEALQPVVELRVGTSITTQAYSLMTGGENAVAELRFTLAEGETAHLQVLLVSPTSTLDSGTITAAWNPTAQLGVQALLLPEAQAQGGFTETDRANLTDVEEATTTLQTSQINPAIRVALGIADLALNFPVNRLAALECQAYTGRGSLTRPGGGFPVNAFGIRWNIVLVPESFGRRDGAILEYIERVAQLVKINHDTNGNLYVDDVEDIFHTGGTMAWSWNNLPAEVQYDVTPGCQVEFCWLLL